MRNRCRNVTAMSVAANRVADNIEAFGGDPKNVTLVGHNRGAAIANILMLSPMARGKNREEARKKRAKRMRTENDQVSTFRTMGKNFSQTDR